MRFLLILLVALSLTLAWQSSVIAGSHGGEKAAESAETTKGDKKKKGKDGAEPECD